VNVHFYHQMAMHTHGVRRSGSAAVDLAWVSCGRLDFFWEFGLNPWDMAAGRLIVAEAGGRISDMKGQTHTLRSHHLLADNGHLHDEVLGLFAEVFQGQFRVPMPQI
jgi:myo-inositol-1(or 4)-monophosphatase